MLLTAAWHIAKYIIDSRPSLPSIRNLSRLRQLVFAAIEIAYNEDSIVRTHRCSENLGHGLIVRPAFVTTDWSVRVREHNSST
jgi:hypothetical protein